MIDRRLVDRARELSDGPLSEEELIHLAVKTYIAVQASHRLAALGGCAPDMADIPRRRWEPDETEAP